MSTQSRYINPFTDFGFKRIFGEEENKELLIDFLNELLREQNIEIRDLTYKKSDQNPVSPQDRKVIFDLYCTNQNGEKFTIELQKAKQTHFKDRMLYYSTFSIQEQGIKGPWDYKLKAVYVIAIMDFPFSESSNEDKVISYIKLLDIENQQVFSDKLNFVTLEIPKFNKQENQLETNLDKWLFLLKHLHEFENIPAKLQTKLLEKVFKIAEYSAMSKNARDEYEDSLKVYNDLKNVLDTAEIEGFQKAEGIYLPQIEKERKQKEEALTREMVERKQKEEALTREIEERKQKEDANQTLRTTILNLKAKGFDLATISSVLNKTEAEIKHLIDLSN